MLKIAAMIQGHGHIKMAGKQVFHFTELIIMYSVNLSP